MRSHFTFLCCTDRGNKYVSFLGFKSKSNDDADLARLHVELAQTVYLTE